MIPFKALETSRLIRNSLLIKISPLLSAGINMRNHDEIKSRSILNFKKPTRHSCLFQTNIDSHRQPKPKPRKETNFTLFSKITRLDKPIGTLLLFIPCTWTILLSTNTTIIPQYMFLFAAGSVLLRGAGCVINDIWDRDIDKLVKRTLDRPLASGSLSLSKAVMFLGAQLFLGLGILVQFNTATTLLGVGSLGLVAIYPLMKRITGLPQLFLGLTFNYGVLMGWSCWNGLNDIYLAIPFYLAGIFWTLVYDTVYALQDKHDDLKTQGLVKSTAITFGSRIIPVLTGFAAASVGCFGVGGMVAGITAPYFYAGVCGAAIEYSVLLRMLKGYIDLELKNGGSFGDTARAGYGDLFRNSWRIGFWISTGLLANILI